MIDADLIGRKRNRFPNLACMKISAYHKQQGHEVTLITNYKDLYYDENLWINYDNALNKYVKKQSEETYEELFKCMTPCFNTSNIKFDKIFISKVFTETEIDEDFLTLDIVEYGGTGFYYDKAQPLPEEIEHIMPDYQLYTEFVHDALENGTMSKKDASLYLDYSIGFTTRGCIRGCSFCVNKNSRACVRHSPVSEFVDPDRKYIFLLDDNVLSCRDWKQIFEELNATGKRFQFKQGMDERLLTDEKCEVIFNSDWIGDFIFAFDNIKDKRLVVKKLQMIRKHTNKIPKFYCFCAYNHDHPDTYPEEFWGNDIADLFERISILMRFNSLPYIMRYKDFEKSPYRGMYVTIARWCNQPSYFKKMSFRKFCERTLECGSESAIRYAIQFEHDFPEIAEKYFDMKWR